MDHDRLHARQPTHDVERWSEGTVESVGTRDGHRVVTVRTESGGTTDLVVTFAVYDLFVGRLDVEAGASPVGERVWYRTRGE